MTFEQFVASVAQKDPNLRDGQHYMHLLFRQQRPLYEMVAREITCDPFYDDRNIPEFLECVGTYWVDTTP